MESDSDFADVERVLLPLVDTHRATGVVPLDALNGGLPRDLPVAAMDHAFAFLARSGLTVGDASPRPGGQFTERHDERAPSVPDRAAFFHALAATERLRAAILSIGERFGKGLLDYSEVTERSPARRGPDRLRQREDLLKKFERVRELGEHIGKIRAVLVSKKMSEVKRKELKAAVKLFETQMADEIETIHLSRLQTDRIVRKLGDLIKRVDDAERDLNDCERRVGVPLKELKRRLRDARADGGERRKLVKKFGLSPEEYEELDRAVRVGIRKIHRVQEEAMLPVEDLRRVYRAVDKPTGPSAISPPCSSSM
jgi:hypothetical protein